MLVVYLMLIFFGLFAIANCALTNSVAEPVDVELTPFGNLKENLGVYDFTSNWGMLSAFDFRGKTPAILTVKIDGLSKSRAFNPTYIKAYVGTTFGVNDKESDYNLTLPKIPGYKMIEFQTECIDPHGKNSMTVKNSTVPLLAGGGTMIITFAPKKQKALLSSEVDLNFSSRIKNPNPLDHFLLVTGLSDQLLIEAGSFRITDHELIRRGFSYTVFNGEKRFPTLLEALQNTRFNSIEAEPEELDAESWLMVDQDQEVPAKLLLVTYTPWQQSVVLTTTTDAKTSFNPNPIVKKLLSRGYSTQAMNAVIPLISDDDLIKPGYKYKVQVLQENNSIREYDSLIEAIDHTNFDCSVMNVATNEDLVPQVFTVVYQALPQKVRLRYSATDSSFPDNLPSEEVLTGATGNPIAYPPLPQIKGFHLIQNGEENLRTYADWEQQKVDPPIVDVVYEPDLQEVTVNYQVRDGSDLGLAPQKITGRTNEVINFPEASIPEGYQIISDERGENLKFTADGKKEFTVVLGKIPDSNSAAEPSEANQDVEDKKQISDDDDQAKVQDLSTGSFGSESDLAPDQQPEVVEKQLNSENAQKPSSDSDSEDQLDVVKSADQNLDSKESLKREAPLKSEAIATNESVMNPPEETAEPLRANSGEDTVIPPVSDLRDRDAEIVAEPDQETTANEEIASEATNEANEISPLNSEDLATRFSEIRNLDLGAIDLDHLANDEVTFNIPPLPDPDPITLGIETNHNNNNSEQPKPADSDSDQLGSAGIVILLIDDQSYQQVLPTDYVMAGDSGNGGDPRSELIENPDYSGGSSGGAGGGDSGDDEDEDYDYYDDDLVTLPELGEEENNQLKLFGMILFSLSLLLLACLERRNAQLR